MLFHMEDDTWRLKKAEKLQGFWKSGIIMLLAAILIYCWMAYLGMGSNLVSQGAIGLDPTVYNVHKLWYVAGRILFAAVFWGGTLFGVAALFHMVTEIPFRKLVIMQQLVFGLLLVERLIWIPLAVYAGLDWFSSPMSLGVIAGYLTSKSWIIYFFGAISIFKIAVMFLQVHFIRELSDMSKSGVWASVIFLHVFQWCLTALFAAMDTYMIGGWFG